MCCCERQRERESEGSDVIIRGFAAAYTLRSKLYLSICSPSQTHTHKIIWLCIEVQTSSIFTFGNLGFKQSMKT